MIFKQQYDKIEITFNEDDSKSQRDLVNERVEEIKQVMIELQSFSMERPREACIGLDFALESTTAEKKNALRKSIDKRLELIDTIDSGDIVSTKQIILTRAYLRTIDADIVFLSEIIAIDKKYRVKRIILAIRGWLTKLIK
jgi:hypothetical protein